MKVFNLCCSLEFVNSAVRFVAPLHMYLAMFIDPRIADYSSLRVDL